jgi:hypothetical protein
MILPHDANPGRIEFSETTSDSSPQGNGELMTQKKVLGFKPAPRLEQVGHKRPNQVKDGKHRVG